MRSSGRGARRRPMLRGEPVGAAASQRRPRLPSPPLAFRCWSATRAWRCPRRRPDSCSLRLAEVLGSLTFAMAVMMMMIGDGRRGSAVRCRDDNRRHRPKAEARECHNAGNPPTLSLRLSRLFHVHPLWSLLAPWEVTAQFEHWPRRLRDRCVVNADVIVRRNPPWGRWSFAGGGRLSARGAIRSGSTDQAPRRSMTNPPGDCRLQRTVERGPRKRAWAGPSSDNRRFHRIDRPRSWRNAPSGITRDRPEWRGPDQSAGRARG